MPAFKRRNTSYVSPIRRKVIRRRTAFKIKGRKSYGSKRKPTKKYGTSQFSEYFPLADNALNSQVVSDTWRITNFSLDKYIMKMLAEKVRKAQKGYQIKWMKIALLKQNRIPLYYGFLHQSSASDLKSMIVKHGLKAGVKELNRRVVVNPKTFFQKFHGSFPTQTMESATSMVTEAVSPVTLNLALINPVQQASIPDNMFQMSGIPAHGHTTAPKVNVGDFFDIKVTLGYNRITN